MKKHDRGLGRGRSLGPGLDLGPSLGLSLDLGLGVGLCEQSALRVSRAVTRLTVYRPLSINGQKSLRFEFFTSQTFNNEFCNV